MITEIEKRRYKEKIAKGILWFAAGITIAILIVIIGYIMFRGVVSDRQVEYDVIDKGNSVIAVQDHNKEDLTILINSGIRIDELTMDDLKELFTGDRKNWGKISEQDIDVSIFGLKEGNEIRNSFDQVVIGEEGEYGRKTVFLDSEEEMIENIASTPGAIGYISFNKTSEIRDKDIKIPEIRRISIIVNPAVLEDQNNQLEYITNQNIQDIFSGKVSNWSQIGGTDLPIRVVTYTEGNNIAKEFNELVMGEDIEVSANAIYVSNMEEMIEALESNPGAVGYSYYEEAVAQEQEIVKIERREVKLNFTLNFLLEEPKQAGQVGGISTIIVNTIYMILLTLLFSVPIGVGAAIFFAEYAKEGVLVRILEFGTETLSGIPSIIFGLFGFIFFSNYLNLGVGLISGSLTLTIMILPTIIRTSEEAFKTVPLSYREGSLALGATKWQTIRKVVVPAATPGILTGIILGMGRAIGETAALLFTMGTDYRLADSLSSSARTLSVHLYILAKEGISFERAFATGTLLIILVLFINSMANHLIEHMNKLKG